MRKNQKEFLPLDGKKIVLGITGSIAAYKSADLTSLLVKQGAFVQTILTESASQFITPRTLGTLSGRTVCLDLLTNQNHYQPDHIEVADWADLLLIAPASANCIAKCTYGIADDFLSCVYLATESPVLIAPAMNGKMYQHFTTQRNLNILQEHQIEIIEPVFGILACGYQGIGKLAPLETIVKATLNIFKI